MIRARIYHPFLFHDKNSSLSQRIRFVFPMPLPFIYINGWPGVGKHTIARELKTLLSEHGPVKVVSIPTTKQSSRISFPPPFSSHELLPPLRTCMSRSTTISTSTSPVRSSTAPVPATRPCADDSGPSSSRRSPRTLTRSSLCKSYRAFPCPSPLHLQTPNARSTFLTSHKPTPTLTPQAPRYVFTDFSSDDELGTGVANEYASAAQARGCAFIPVVLTCAVEENVRRMRSAERVELVSMGKGLLLDTTLLETMRGDHGLFRFRRVEELELDVGGVEAGEAARMIAEHVERVVGGKDER